MFAVGVFEFDELRLHLSRMLLHVVEELLVYVETFEGMLHLRGQHRVLVLHFFFEEASVCVKARHPRINLFKDVEFAARIVDRVLQLLDLRRHILLAGRHLVLGVFLLDESVNDWVHNLLDQVTRLRHDIEPEQFEGGVLLRETLKVSHLHLRSLLFLFIFGLSLLQLQKKRIDYEMNAHILVVRLLFPPHHGLSCLCCGRDQVTDLSFCGCRRPYSPYLFSVSSFCA